MRLTHFLLVGVVITACVLGLLLGRTQYAQRKIIVRNSDPSEQINAAIGELRTEQALYSQALGRAIGELANEQHRYSQALGRALGELANEQHRSLSQMQAELDDLESSSSLLLNNLTATAAELGVKHSPRDIDIRSIDNYDALDQNWNSFSDASRRVNVACHANRDAAVIVTLGQSNAANYATTPYTPKHDVLNFNIYDGSCYRAEDPLLGASGTGGNFATVLGDMLIERGFYQRVIVAPIAMGGSLVEEWADEGMFNRRILVLIRRLYDADLLPSHILWHQGEGDPGKGDSHGRRYRKNLVEVISTFRRYGIDAPFFVALATKCGVYPRPNGDYIREGQRSTVNELMHVFLGPDTDTLGDEYRDTQHCHFNAEGLRRTATLWADSIMSYEEKKSKTVPVSQSR